MKEIQNIIGDNMGLRELSDIDTHSGLNSDSAKQPILKIITEFLSKEGQPTYEWKDETTISFLYRGQQSEWRCYVSGRDADFLCCFYSISPFVVPEEKRLLVSEFMTRVNYTLTVGNFEMDFFDGEVRFRTSLDVEGDRLSTSLFKQLTIANVTMMDQHLPGIVAIVHHNLTPVDAFTLVKR